MGPLLSCSFLLLAENQGLGVGFLRTRWGDWVQLWSGVGGEAAGGKLDVV